MYKLKQEDEHALSYGMWHRAGIDMVDDNAPESVRNEQAKRMELGDQFRDLTMIEVCAEIVHKATGTRNYSSGRDMIREAMSTGSLTAVFTTTFNALVEKAFGEFPDSTQGFCRERLVKNFMTRTVGRMAQMTDLTVLPRGGTADHAALDDSKEEYRVSRFAKKLVIDDMSIIDDQFDILENSAEALGVAARRVRPNLVYSLLLENAALGADSIELFHGSHNNLATGGGSSLSASSLAAAWASMGKQTADGVNINISPKFLLCSPDLMITARILLRSADRSTTAADIGSLNPFYDEQIIIRSDSRLGVSGVTDPLTGEVRAGSATAWYLIADPRVAAAIEVGYIRGSGKKPEVRGYELTSGQFGLGWDVKFELGAKAIAFQACYKSDGA